MKTPFTPVTTDNSYGALINRALQGAFMLAVITAVGVMTFVQFLSMA
jgi:hypothetical protein